MRLFVVLLSAGILSLASCNGPREAASSSDENAGFLAQPSPEAPASARGVDREQPGFARIQVEDSRQGNFSHGDDHAAKANPNAVERDGGQRNRHANHHVAGNETLSSGRDHRAANHAHVGQHGSPSHRHGSDSHAHHDASDNAKKLMIGEKVPDFEVTIDGKNWKLSELRKNTEITKDGTLVLTFWCSFCHSCRHVEHQLNELATKYKSRVGVIALDASAGETRETVAKFAEKRGLTLPIALSASGTAADIFGVRATTTTVVIDSHGVLRYRGQFIDNQHNFAEDALQAVLVGEDVRQKETAQKG